MKTVCAFARMITPNLARAAIIGTGKKPKTVVMHPAQITAIAMLFDVIAIESIEDIASLEDIESVRKLAKEYQPSTFMGMEIVQDVTMPNSWMEFRDENGETIARIDSLAIPIGFQSGAP